MSGKNSIFWPVMLVTILGLVIVVPVVLLYLSTAGAIYGEEFCPDDFSRRSFSYNVVPMIGLPIFGISYDSTTSDLSKDLVLGGMISTKKQARWDLISDSASPTDSIDFDARFLTKYLDLTDEDGASLFSAWNEKCPNSAAFFWPIVADLARHRIYWAIPIVMRNALATEKDENTSFNDFVTRSAADAFCEQAVVAQAEDDHGLAIELFSKSIKYLPSRSAFMGRSSSHTAMGKSGQSKADEEAANKFGS